MSAWSALARRARRLALRSPSRTLWTGSLVLLAVAVGTAAMSSVWGHHVRSSSVERAFGAADAVYAAGPTPPATVGATVDSLDAALPRGSEVAVEQRVDGLVAQGPTGGWAGSARLADWDDPLLDGVLTLVDGRPPGTGEVVVSPRSAQEAGVGVGDELSLVGSSVPLAVVGLGTVGNSDDGIVLAPGQLVAVEGAAPTAATELRFYVRAPSDDPLPTGMDIAGADGSAGTAGLRGPSYRDPAGRLSPDGYVAVDESADPVGGLAAASAGVVVVVGLLAGAAFGIGSRRRSRATGILAANGADAGQLRIAAATEALVVAVPAAVLGVVIARVLLPAWTRFHLPGWVSVADATLPWAWVTATVVGAVAVAVAGAVLFSAGSRTRTTSSLLDEREVLRRPVAGPQRIGWLGWLGLGILGWTGFNVLLGAAVGRSTVGGVALLTAVVLWAACAFGALRLARVFLRRGPVGRLVDRDLARQRIGSIATVVVVATWVFVAVGGTATEWFESTVVTASGATGYSSTPATVVDGPTTTAVSDPGPVPPVPAPSSAVLIRSTTGPTVGTGWVVRGSEPPGPAATSGLPDGLTAELRAAGLDTADATVGQWVGSCSICPAGYVPSVLVLEGVDGLGLPPATTDLLRSGAAITPFDVAGVEDQRVAGVPVRTAPLPLDANAAVLAAAVTDGSQLSDARPALVGSAAGLDAAGAERVAALVRGAGLELSTEEPTLARAWSDVTAGGIRTSSPSPTGGPVWGWLVVLVLVTLAATAAHRREHGEAARVLRVLGAPPGSGRRLASLTAGSLAGVGVGLGLTGAVVVLVVSAVRRGTDPAMAGLWNAEATLLLVAALAVPLVVAALAALLPPYRTADGPGVTMPA